MHGAVRTHRKSRETIAQSEGQPTKNEVTMLIEKEKEKETKKKKQRSKEKEKEKEKQRFIQ